MLTENGYTEAAYRILQNEKAPGWLYEVSKGATTTWENWYGVDEKGVPTDSHNHFAPGSVVAWLFRTCAGIQPLLPGFEEILIRPVPGGALTWVRAEAQTPKGMVSSAWELEGNLFTLAVHTPEDVPLTIQMPDGGLYHLPGGEHRLIASKVIAFPFAQVYVSVSALYAIFFPAADVGTLLFCLPLFVIGRLYKQSNVL